MQALLVVLAALTLQWDASPTTTNFILESRNPGESWGSPASLPTTNCVLRDRWKDHQHVPTLVCKLPITRSWKRVKACNDGGCSDWAEERRLSCIDLARPLQPGEECPITMWPTETPAVQPTASTLGSANVLAKSSSGRTRRQCPSAD